MPLSCSCDYDYEFEEGDWYYDICDPDFEPLNFKRSKRCCSCGELIKPGGLSLAHIRVRYPYDELESRKKLSLDLDDAMEHEASIRIADHHQCEKCGEIWLNLQEVGFECLSPAENMQEMLKEYQREYAPAKLEPANG
ncbi:MAG: hypothetical protein P8X74_03765 [Reinekea sp.]